MKKTMVFVSIVAALGLAGCASQPRDLDGINSKIAEAESGDFGTCIAEAHKANTELDYAKTVVKTVDKGAYWTASGYYASTGMDAAQAGIEHRQKAEAACMALLDPLIKRLDDLESRVAYLESLHEVLKGVTFYTASAELTPQAKTVLNVVANAIQRRPVPVEIGGYASKTGGEQFNLELSQRRAESVRNYLISKGVDGSLLSAKGYGWADPVASNDTADGRRANQRVELVRQ